MGARAQLEHGLTEGLALHAPPLPGLAAGTWTVGVAVSQSHRQLAYAVDDAIRGGGRGRPGGRDLRGLRPELCAAALVKARCRRAAYDYRAISSVTIVQFCFAEAPRIVAAAAAGARAAEATFLPGGDG